MLYLAQVNIARMLAPIDSAVMKDFVDNLDRINAVAEAHPGFVWRLKTDDNNATSIRVFDDDFMIINMSVWKDGASLYDFVYRSSHLEVFKRRAEWFEKMKDGYTALWYVPANHAPSPQEAIDKLAHLRTHGDSAEVFSIRKLAASIRGAAI